MNHKSDKNLQYEFLPAALEITETPPSPLGRIVVWSILAIFVTALLWASIGKVDVVAVGRGKVIPDGRLKVVQPLEEGIIVAIHIDEGQRVKKGEVLIELDSTMKTVDVESIEKSIKTMEFENDLFKNALKGGNIGLITKNGIADGVKQHLVEFTQAKIAEDKVKQGTLNAIIMQYQVGVELQQAILEKLETSLTMEKEMEQKIQALYEAGAIEKQKWLDANNQIILSEKDLQIQTAKVEQSKSLLIESTNNLENFNRERETLLLNQVVNNDKKIIEMEALLTKSRKSVEFQTLTSPVDGTVQGLASNTIGGIVTPAQPILNIVPDDTPLVVETLLPNKDIGFVSVGQEVANKFDTYSFQKYGTVKGTVINISPDAFEDEKLGSVYKMKISLDKTTVELAGNEFSITSGMAVTSEIMTGKRRIIEFFLEPIMKYANESLTLR